jgi:hypothetical protein
LLVTTDLNTRPPVSVPRPVPQPEPRPDGGRARSVERVDRWLRLPAAADRDE